MTLKELSENGTPEEKYRFLDGVWWEVEGYLAHLLPDGYEEKYLNKSSIYGDFQALRYRIHDVFSIESRKNK